MIRRRLKAYIHFAEQIEFGVPADRWKPETCLLKHGEIYLNQRRQRLFRIGYPRGPDVDGVIFQDPHAFARLIHSLLLNEFWLGPCIR